MIPVRCFTCGKTVSTAWHEFKARRRKARDPKKIPRTILNISRTAAGACSDPQKNYFMKLIL